jgi:hypothetical protein
MKALATTVLLTLVVATPAAANSIEFDIGTVRIAPYVPPRYQPPRINPFLPITIKLVNNQGEKIGTATISNGKTYVRDLNQILIATIVEDADGNKVMYDPDGKVVARGNSITIQSAGAPGAGSQPGKQEGNRK